MNILVNKYQTQITDDLLNGLPQEVQDQFLDIINNVQFVKNLISPARQYAKDRPRDSKGRIIVDLSNPHILENMDYFRPTALYYKEHGCFTSLRPNSNPNSEYGKWIREERNRCWNGYIRESDGEWVTGPLYFFMNYCPIIQSKIRKGTKQADRIVDFPEMWEGIYWRFHYMDQARNGGIYNEFLGGNHGAELASRGKAFAYSQEIETPQGRKKWGEINIGDTLFAPDGTITKVVDIPFNEEHDVYKMTLVDGRTVFTTLEHLWKINKDGKSCDKLITTKEILESGNINRFSIEVSAGVDYKYKDVSINPYILGLILGDDSFTTDEYSQFQITSRKEGIKKVSNTKSQQLNYLELNKKIKELNLQDRTSYNKFIPECYKYNSREIRKQILKGLFDINGTIHDSSRIELCTLSIQLAEDICWIARSLGYNASYWEKSTKFIYKEGKYVGKTCYIIYVQTHECLFNFYSKIKLYNKKSKKLYNKLQDTPIKSIEYSHREMCKCVTVDREDGLFLIGDFIITHNSKSYSMASILTHNFILGENSTACKEIVSIATAYQKEYLIKDGVLNKFISMANFCAENTQFPRKRLKSSLQDMAWKMGYIDAELDVEKGTQNSVLGVSSKDDESKLRGKRAAFIGIEEFGCHIKGTKVLMYDGSIKNVEDILIGDKLMGNDNTPRIVQKLYNGRDQLYKITLSNGDYQIVNSCHPVYFKKYNWKDNTYTEHTLTAPELLKIKNLNKEFYIPKAIIHFPYTPVAVDPYFLGLWLGDNPYNNKYILQDYKINSSEIQLQVVAGLIDAIGIYNPKKNFFEIKQSCDKKYILEDIKFMCESNGLRCSMTSRVYKEDNKDILYYKLRISGNLTIIPTKTEGKKGIDFISYKNRKSWNDYTFKVEPYKVDEYYGFTVDKNHLFVLGDLTITHNTFPRLIDLYNVMLPSVQEGDYVFGLMYLQGTAGDNESDFAGAQEIMYNPKGYNIYALPNVYDKDNQGKKDFVFFFPGYINRKGSYNEDGVSDVIQAIIEILKNRYRVKYNSTDPNTVIKTIAEIPITPAEAIVKAGINMFPVTDLTERLGQIDANPREFDDVYTGDLIMDNNKEVVFKPTSNVPIRDFPHKDNKVEGAIEIYKLPEEDKTGKVFNNRYILGCLKEGELVNTDSGFKRVEDITLKDRLVNIDGKYVKIHNLQKYKNIEPVYKVKLSSIIDTTTFSSEHPIYCCTPKYNKYNFDFRKVSELKEGDIVKSPILYTYETKINEFNNPEIWYLLGIILGMGWANNDDYSIVICFNKEEEYLINRCKSIIENILGSSFILNKKKDSILEYTFHHKELSKYFSKYFEKDIKSRCIDFSLKTIPYEYRKNLILGYIDSSGYIYKNTINISSTFKTLLNDIQDWLFSMKIASNIRISINRDVHIINNTNPNPEIIYSLSVGTLGLNTMKDWGLESMKIGNYTKVKVSNHDKKDIIFDGNYMYIKVESVEVDDYIGDVYNFECDTHTFMCNYIPTHNCDPYDDDESNTMSLGSVFVLDLWTDKIVAEYTGRPVFADDFYEICRKMCLFYNGRMNYENNKKGLFAYFSKMNCLYLLTDTLEFLKDKDMIKGSSYGNKAKGTNAIAAINAYARYLLRSWLLKPVPVIQTIDGEDKEVMIPNLYTIRSRALIKELILYNTQGNFDRISSMGMLMLLREDRMILYGGDVNKSKEEDVSSAYLGDDPFFKINYDMRFK